MMRHVVLAALLGVLLAPGAFRAAYAQQEQRPIYPVGEVDAAPGPATDATIAETDPLGDEAAQPTDAAAAGVAQTDTLPEFTGGQFGIVGTFERIIHAGSGQEAIAAFFAGNAEVIRAADDPAAKPYGLFLQTDATGEPAYLAVDLSWLKNSTGEPGFVDLQTNIALGGEYESVRLDVREQADGTFLAIQHGELAKGSMVNNTDFGVQERMTVYDDAINASGVCDDDENCGFFDDQQDDE